VTNWTKVRPGCRYSGSSAQRRVTSFDEVMKIHNGKAKNDEGFNRLAEWNGRLEAEMDGLSKCRKTGISLLP